MFIFFMIINDAKWLRFKVATFIGLQNDISHCYLCIALGHLGHVVTMECGRS